MLILLIIAFLAICFIPISLISIFDIALPPDIFFKLGEISFYLFGGSFAFLGIRNRLKSGPGFGRLLAEFDAFDKKVLGGAVIVGAFAIAFFAAGFKLEGQ